MIDKNHMQKGSIVGWLVLVVVIVVGGYVYYSYSPAVSTRGLDCAKYVTAHELSGALTLSDQTTAQVDVSTEATCRISWNDSSRKIGNSPVSSGTITVSLSSTPSDVSSLCGKSESLHIGTASCYTGTTGVPNGGLAFQKGNKVVKILPVSVQVISSEQIIQLSKIIEGRL